MADILEIKKVSKIYNSQSHNPVTALNDVDLNVAEGEFVSIIGPSGCGKSTLFNVIGGLIDDHEGEVLIEGRPVDGAHKDVGVVFQEESTFPWRSTLDNVAFPLEIEGIDKDEREELALRVGIAVAAALSGRGHVVDSGKITAPVVEIGVEGADACRGDAEEEHMAE